MAFCRKCGTEIEGGFKYCPECGDELPSSGCFIATAAYGTPFAKEIDVLRCWRDSYLKTSFTGRIFVNTYYKISPPIAEFISRREYLKGFVRFFLNPYIKILKRKCKFGKNGILERKSYVERRR